MSADLNAGTCSHTDITSPQPWWRDDLGISKTVSVVDIVNRDDCSERLTDYQVSVGDSPNVLENPLCPGGPYTSS